MKELHGKTAVVSGGAEGIGLGIAKVMGRLGMNIVLADIDPSQLQIAESGLREQGIPVLAVTLDAADLDQWKQAAERAVERFGKVHMLVNNAGVGGIPGAIDETQQSDWRWVVDVNLMGVVHGAQTMVPLMKQHGEGGWLVNVASMAGFGGMPLAGAYSATKAAVVAMTECWRTELEAHEIFVCVLCPGFVKTRINLSQRNRQGQYQRKEDANETSSVAAALSGQMQQVIDAGLDPELVAERLVEGIAARELYVFTHPGYRPAVRKRFLAIDGAFERSRSSPLLASVVDQKIPGMG